MKKTIQTIFLLAVFGISAQLILVSSSNGRAFAASTGNTGAPGENTTCRTCHGTAFGTTVSLVFKDTSGAAVTSYIPGDVYTIDYTVNTTTGSPQRYGFQLVGLDTLNAAVNGFESPSSNSRIVTLGNGRQYAEHAGKSSSNTFSVKWAAPTVGVGSVIFYGGGAAVNNNRGTGGDGGNTTSLKILENTSVGIEENQFKNELSIYPNPATDVLFIKAKTNRFTTTKVSIINQQGQLVLEKSINLNTANKEMIPVYDLNRGLYILRIEEGNNSISSKVLLN